MPEKVYKEGDEITMTEEMLQKLEADVLAGAWWRNGVPAGTRGRCYVERVNRHFGMMCVRWSNGVKTNIFKLEETDLKFEDVKMPTLELRESPVEYLSDQEKVMRGMLEEGVYMETAFDAIEAVLKGMKRYGVVFYVP